MQTVYVKSPKRASNRRWVHTCTKRTITPSRAYVAFAIAGTPTRERSIAALKDFGKIAQIPVAACQQHTDLFLRRHLESFRQQRANADRGSRLCDQLGV